MSEIAGITVNRSATLERSEEGSLRLGRESAAAQIPGKAERKESTQSEGFEASGPSSILFDLEPSGEAIKPDPA